MLFLQEIQLAMAADLRPGRARKKDPMVISLLFAAEIGCDAQNGCSCCSALCVK
jgi:hypothetical protein